MAEVCTTNVLSRTNIQVAGLVYNYIQSIHETHNLELQHVQRDLEIQAIIRSHEETTHEAECSALKQSLERLKSENGNLLNKISTLKSSSAELSTARDVKHTELERRNQKLGDEIEMLKKQKEANAKAVIEKRQVEKELQQTKVQLETTRNKLSKEEGTRSTLQGTEKDLKSEIQQLKAQLKQATTNADKANSDLEKVKRKHESEKKVLESKLESLKSKSKVDSPAKNLPFSPIRKSMVAPTPRKTGTANVPKSTFSTTPFLQKTKPVISSPSKTLLSPSPKKPQQAARKRSSLIRPLKPEQVTITTKDNKQRSLFDDSDGEDGSGLSGKDAEPDKKKRRKLKASKSAFDEDDEDDRSWFKKRPPTTSGKELGVISPLKKEKNNGMRSIFKV